MACHIIVGWAESAYTTKGGKHFRHPSPPKPAGKGTSERSDALPDAYLSSEIRVTCNHTKLSMDECLAEDGLCSNIGSPGAVTKR
jgi:hypothetical protein